MHYHGYADGHHLYLFVTHGERWSESLDLVEKWVAEIGDWMAENTLCLNMEKTELMVFGRRGCPELTNESKTTVKSASVIRKLRVMQDTNMSMVTTWSTIQGHGTTIWVGLIASEDICRLASAMLVLSLVIFPVGLRQHCSSCCAKIFTGSSPDRVK